MKIGFAGLGRMGSNMAANIARADFELILWNRTTKKAQDLANKLDCTFVETPAELTETCDVVITMLADDRASQDAYFGEHGLFSEIGARSFIEMGTMSPSHIKALAAACPSGAILIDAPVSGATQAAREAQLLIMAGCNESDAKEIAPLFEAMGKQTIYLGKCGAACVMKLAVNSMIHGINQNFAEAMVLAEAAGIETTTAFDVIDASAACAPMIKYRRDLYLDEASKDVTFTVALARKDMEVTINLANEMGITLPQNKVTLEKLQQAEATGYAERDMAAILQFMREKK